jgi:coenzyme F420-reducing hydrogenase gamma subunit
VAEFTRAVYATPAYIHTLEQSTPISSHVAADFEVNGCPINKYQILEVITALLVGRAPHLPGNSVCMECKKRGTVCVMVARGLPCLGPVTQTGCGAICPAYNRGCYGCFGPLEAPNSDSLSAQLLKDGMQRGDLVRLFRGFTGFAEAFRSAGDKWDKAT